MAKIWLAIKHEIGELLPGFLFFFFAFALIVWTDALTTKQYGIRPFSIAAAIIGAFVVAKAMLIANLLPAMNRYEGKPLVYNVAWKGLIYLITALVVVYLEHLIERWLRYGSFVEANRHLLGDMDWPRFWAVHIWLIVLLLLYAFLQELNKAMGEKTLRRMFFGI